MNTPVDPERKLSGNTPAPTEPTPSNTPRQSQKALETLWKVIKTYYDLGEISVPHTLEAAHQRRHRKLIVDTSKGRFLVKTYSRDLAVLDALRFQHRLAEHLHNNRLPVPQIQPATTGRRIVEIDNWALELQEFVEGIPMQVTARTLATSAKALGKWHEVCREFPRPERDARMWRFSEVPRETFGNFYERAKADVSDVDVDAHCNTVALFLQEAAGTLSLEARSRFETGLIHGDWHSGNLLFVGERLVGIVDLEFAGDGCFLEDLSYAVSNLCIRTTTDPIRLANRTELLLEQYQRWRTLSPAEERALYYAVGVKHVATVSYQSQQRDGRVAGIKPSEWMERLAFQCQWLRKRSQKVVSGT